MKQTPGSRYTHRYHMHRAGHDDFDPSDLGPLMMGVLNGLGIMAFVVAVAGAVYMVVVR